MPVYRCYTEKKAGFDVESRAVLSEARDFLGLRGLSSARLFARYDIEGVTEAEYRAAREAILSEPAVDNVYDEALPELSGDAFRLAVEALPGQYDQRADSCAQCVQLITRGERPAVRAAKVYVFFGKLTDDGAKALRAHLINPVESREASPAKPATLAEVFPAPEKIKTLAGFTEMTDAEPESLRRALGLAMDADDLRFTRAWFRDREKRDPTETELRILDTYWSDHCRHTTFLTRIENVTIRDEATRAAYDRYLGLRREVYGEEGAESRPVTLMDVATIAAKALKKRGLLRNLDISDEVNACSVHIGVETDAGAEDWLLMFKNETHNHPTEIEPFGGAATCIGGAIRDPLSGRAYVYQAMRVTGSGDPRAPGSETLAGKLPQRRITTAAARGYSSYGNQIGLATGLVREIYHPGYIAKRMEIGAVVGAVKYSDVRRETPAPGDAVILLGGRTGRDGIGGATGSSKTHDDTSVTAMSGEVQKGNAPEERKLQRLFRDAEVTRMIKRCNDFGAGGVSVAIGELADGLDIDLSSVRRKYEGLGATELAISESQERMAVVVAESDAEAFIAKAGGENLEACVVARVTGDSRMTMRFGGETAADLPRELLASNGAPRRAEASVPRFELRPPSVRGGYAELSTASARGLSELFDASVGAGSVLSPYGGGTQRTPVQAMAALVPVKTGETCTCSVMAYGFDPYLSEANPYLGARHAVTVSLAKLVAAGCDPDAAYLTFQEYFEKPGRDPARWGKPLSALLGALDAQMELETAAVGGKDSMSGSFDSGEGELGVPPTLVSFAVAPADARHVVSPEFKAAGHGVALFPAGETLAETKRVWRRVHEKIKNGEIISAWAVAEGGAAEGLVSMSFGNEIGFEGIRGFDPDIVAAGAVIAELSRPEPNPDGGYIVIGRTTAEKAVSPRFGGERVAISELLRAREGVLEDVFPTRAEQPGEAPALSFGGRPARGPAVKSAKPRAVVLAFPGTNSEIDTERALTRAGAEAEVVVLRNLTPKMLSESIEAARAAILRSRIAVLPGGFAGGDEPDGSAKFITAFFRSPAVADAVREFLGARDGLMLGICNGFQALIKLGLVPFGEIVPPSENPFTLTHNIIGRHRARYAYTRVASVASPWMLKSNVGDVHALPVSHGEGRFAAPEGGLRDIIARGGIATQYSDIHGSPSMDISVNPNGSTLAVEGLFSPDGRVFGKMGHSERRGEFVAKNIAGDKYQPIFESGVYYFK
jgi:phosphoribosylformylglycinamidine synthase